MISVGIIGAGIIAQSHVKAIQAHTGSRLQAVADVVAERAQSIAQQCGANAYTDYLQMLDNEKLDVVIINLPHALHEPAVLACAAHKMHVLLEKPMSVSEVSCRRMVEACKEAGVLLQIGHVQRYIPENRAAREIIASGELGELVMVQSMRSGPYFTEKRPAWFLKKELAGGGIWMNLGAHALDQMCYLTGSTIASITGKCTWLQEGTDVDGSAQAMVQMTNGVTGVVAVCGYKVAGLYEIIVHMTKGTLHLVPGVSLRAVQNGKETVVDCSQFPSSFTAQWEDFVKGLECGKVLYNDGEYGAHIIRNIEAIWPKS